MLTYFYFIFCPELCKCARALKGILINPWHFCHQSVIQHSAWWIFCSQWTESVDGTVGVLFEGKKRKALMVPWRQTFSFLTCWQFSLEAAAAEGKKKKKSVHETYGGGAHTRPLLRQQKNKSASAVLCKVRAGLYLMKAGQCLQQIRRAIFNTIVSLPMLMSPPCVSPSSSSLFIFLT